jgi:hypothetical protein
MTAFGTPTRFSLLNEKIFLSPLSPKVPIFPKMPNIAGLKKNVGDIGPCNYFTKFYQISESQGGQYRRICRNRRILFKDLLIASSNQINFKQDMNQFVNNKSFDNP